MGTIRTTGKALRETLCFRVLLQQEQYFKIVQYTI